MNVYDAIMKAADRIETDPSLFEYRQARVHGCGSPACAIGWIAFCAGESEQEKWGALDERSIRLLGVDYWHTFEVRMSSLVRRWTLNASDCATALRAYAAKYHAPKIPKRSDSELVSALMARVTSGERIPEDA